MTEILSNPPAHSPPPVTRVDVTSALDRLHAVSAAALAGPDTMNALVDVLIPAVADRCVVELDPSSTPSPIRAAASGPTAPVLLTTSMSPGGATPGMVWTSGTMAVPFASTVDVAFRGLVSCTWVDGYRPSEGDAAVVRAIVDQCVLLADRVQLAEGMQQLQAHTGQLRTAVESNRRIGAAIGVLMVRSGLTEDGAFDALRHTSNTTNRKLREVADEVLYTGSLPEQRPTSRSAAGRVR